VRIRTLQMFATATALVLLTGACAGGQAADKSEEHMTTTTTHPGKAFRTAVERKDLDGLVAMFAEDIELYSPVLPDPFAGKERMRRLFGVLVNTLEDIEILDDFSSADRYVLSFRARVGTEPIHIVDLLTFDRHGLIQTFVVTARPLPGIEAFAMAVAPHLAEIG
jgi:hypothetical protein